MGDWDWLLGSAPERYQADPNAATMGGPKHAYDANASSAQGAQLDQTNYGQERSQQQGLANLLTGAANGQGPSAAGVAGQAARDAALTQASALQAGRRGGNAAAGARAAGVQVGMGQQGAQAQETQGRINEMQGARAQLGQTLGTMAGQDIGVAGQNAQLLQGNNQYNASNAQQIALANQAAQLGISTQELQARERQEQMKYGNLKPGGGGLLPGLMGAGGAIIGGMAGGPAGAQAGYAAGNAVGNGISQASYAKGGFIDHPTVALIGEAGPEMVVPLSPGHKDMQRRAMDILTRIPHLGDGAVVAPSEHAPGSDSYARDLADRLAAHAEAKRKIDLEGRAQASSQAHANVDAERRYQDQPRFHPDAISGADLAYSTPTPATHLVGKDIPHMADGGVAGGDPYKYLRELGGQGPTPQGYAAPLVQTLGIGQRVMPNYNQGTAQTNAGIQALVNAYITHGLEKQSKDRDEAAQRKRNGGYTDAEVKTDPKAAFYAAKAQRDLARASKAGGEADAGDYVAGKSKVPPEQSRSATKSTLGPEVTLPWKPGKDDDISPVTTLPWNPGKNDGPPATALPLPVTPGQTEDVPAFKDGGFVGLSNSMKRVAKGCR